MEDSDCKRMEAFELWANHQLFCIKWVEMYTNEWVVGQLGRKQCLLKDINKWKLSFVGHAIRNKGLGCILLTGMVFGKQKCGSLKMRFIDNFKAIAGISTARVVREA